MFCCLSKISPPLFLNYSQKRQNLLQIGSFQTAVLDRRVAAESHNYISVEFEDLTRVKSRSSLAIALSDYIVATYHIYVVYSKAHSIGQKKDKGYNLSFKYVKGKTILTYFIFIYLESFKFYSVIK